MNAPSVELCDQNECQQLDAFLVERIYEFNARATGYFDGRLVGGRLRGEQVVLSTHSLLAPRRRMHL